ncbi:MAG: hypothetical protein V3W18_07605 [candidate division Zixibacteria bacterium]
MKRSRGYQKLIAGFVFSIFILAIFAESVVPGEKDIVIKKPYGDRNITSPGRAVIEYYNPEKAKAFSYEGDIFIQKEYAPGALRDNVFLVRAYDDDMTYEISLSDIDRFEVRCQICDDPVYCCSDLTIILRDGGTMKGELYSDGPFGVDTVQNANLEMKPPTEFGVKTKRGIVKLRQQSGVRMTNPELNEKLNCAFCSSHFGRIVSCTMEWSSEYKRKLKKHRNK